MFNYTDLTSGRTPDLSGDKLEEFEEALQRQIQLEVSECEDYLEEFIRPNIAENWDYYKGLKPAPLLNEPSFTDNTCTATVDHYVAACMDAFTSGDSLEVVPDGVTNPVVLKVINQIMNDVLDRDNNRHQLYHAFFMDSMVSSASVLRPRITEETKIDKEFFSDVDEEFIQMRQMQLELEDKYDEVSIIVTDKKKIEIQINEPTQPNTLLAALNVDSVTQKTTTVQYSGYFSLISTVKLIKIDPVPAENFLINKDARSISDSRIVGHKSMTTISELLKMGFEYDKVLKVYEHCGSDDDSDQNIASQSRREGYMPMDYSDMSMDESQREVELYELYIKSSVEETISTDKEIAVSKLYQVFYCGNVILSYQEVDEIPYVGGTPIPMPHMFWGDGMVDRTKSIQRAKTGLLRQIFVYNQMASNPRYEYVEDNIKNVRDLFNTQPGAGIGVTALGSIQPIQVTALQGNSADMLNVLDSMRESGTGMSFTGQGMLGEVLQAGGSTASAAMVLSEGQMVQKKVINNLLQSAIIPLISTIYNMLRENFDSWHVEVDGAKIFVNPNTWPELSDVRIKTPLGTNAKAEKAQQYGMLAQTLASAPAGTELSKLSNPTMIRDLMIKSYEYMDISDAKTYFPDDSTIQQKDQLMQGMAQMQQQMAQMAQQLQQLTAQNQVLQQTASQMAMKELEIKEREVSIKENDSRTKSSTAEANMQNMADEQTRKETMDEAIMQNMADEQALAEREEDRKDLQTQTEISTGINLFTNN